MKWFLIHRSDSIELGHLCYIPCSRGNTRTNILPGAGLGGHYELALRAVQKCLWQAEPQQPRGVKLLHNLPKSLGRSVNRTWCRLSFKQNNWATSKPSSGTAARITVHSDSTGLGALGFRFTQACYKSVQVEKNKNDVSLAGPLNNCPQEAQESTVSLAKFLIISLKYEFSMQLHG